MQLALYSKNTHSKIILKYFTIDNHNISATIQK
jgi:hypothetical protein